MQKPRAEQTRREIIRLCHAGLDSRTLRIEIVKRLRTVIPIDVSAFGTADPATLLPTGLVVDDILMRATPQFLENEFLQNDVNNFAQMAKSNTSVMNLVQATQGELERSPRYREILAPLTLGDELRAVLIIGGACWGFMCLHRDQSSPHFTLAEAAYLARLTPHFAEGLRKALLLGSTTGLTVLDEPGLLLLAEDLSVVAITPAAERWLAEVGEADWSHKWALPNAVYAVAGRLQALERGYDMQPDLVPRTRLRTASGHWLVLHASRLSGPGAQGQIAVIFEMARPAEVAPLIVQAYDLSKRESEIMQLVTRGLSTTEMSAEFHISSNTVQDHLKAIFEKVGVRSRRELVGLLFAQQYQPRIEAGHDLDGSGWFR
ncbi:MAG: helix-turn-helix transcriptional regulator [Chloroflexi bacterium]|nr:MAG: helix-turn-helix transcriptional regulator [Chloroflexota bacterium]